MVSPPSKSQVAVISIICLSVTLGYPKSRKDSAALLNRAVGAGSPLNWGVLLKCLPNSRSEERRVGKEGRSWWSPEEESEKGQCIARRRVVAVRRGAFNEDRLRG